MVTIQWRTIGVAPFKGEGGWRYRGINAWSCKIEVKKEEKRGSWANLHEIKGLPF
jgi:hypothetical protein